MIQKRPIFDHFQRDLNQILILSGACCVADKYLLSPPALISLLGKTDAQIFDQQSACRVEQTGQLVSTRAKLVFRAMGQNSGAKTFESRSGVSGKA